MMKKLFQVDSVSLKKADISKNYFWITDLESEQIRLLYLVMELLIWLNDMS